MAVTLEVNKLTKYYSDFLAVDDLNFFARQGEILGFLGPNGAGKSTTMRIITGFISASSGEVYVNGYDVAEHPIKVKKAIGYLPEGVSSYPDMRVIDFLSFIASIWGFYGKKNKKAVSDIIEKVSLGSVVNKRIENLSKGFKRRVGLAKALIHDPDILILDEPTDGLDPNQKHEVRNLIKSIAKDKIIILSTHILEEVEAMCDRVIIISEGKLVVDSRPEQLYKNSIYHNEVTAVIKNAVLIDVRSELEKLTRIKNLELENITGENILIKIRPEELYNPFEDFTHLILKNKWSVEEFYTNKGKLDEVFRNITLNKKEII